MLNGGKTAGTVASTPCEPLVIGGAQTQTSSTSEVHAHTTISQMAASTTQDGCNQGTMQTTDAYLQGLLTHLTRGQRQARNGLASELNSEGSFLSETGKTFWERQFLPAM